MLLSSKLGGGVVLKAERHCESGDQKISKSNTQYARWYQLGHQSTTLYHRVSLQQNYTAAACRNVLVDDMQHV